MLEHDFVGQVVAIMALAPEERHTRMAALHTQIFAEYSAAIRALTAERALRPAAGGDSRTVAQVVGHITEWERFLIMGAGDILAGLRHPRMVTSIAGYREPDGQEPQFASIDAFNTYQAGKHVNTAWPQLQAQALDTATMLHALFTDPRLLSAARLEATEPFHTRLIDRTRISNITMGWNLWITILEHEGVEHLADIGPAHA